jgi:hypothetical protein
MTNPETSSDRALRIFLTLVDYPILRSRIRGQMRKALFDQGILTPKDFETEVRKKALHSQVLEGVSDSLCDETGEMWALRLDRIRRSLTDSYFAQYFTLDHFEKIVQDILSERVQPMDDILTAFNPELAPQEILFEQAQAIEQLDPEDYLRYEYRHNELIVVLIRRIISDQLAYINIAKEWFKAEDLIDIQRRKIGYGRIGGKAAGMLLASTILQRVADEAIRNSLKTPESYFIGADVMYDFMSFNELFHWTDQKYKSQEQIRAEFPLIQEEYQKSDFPPDIIEKLQSLLDKIGRQPLIVRSSSLLEDSFGMSFAGKYESVFCPNQGTPESNLHDFTQAITRVYASVLNPDALFYRRSMKLQDYDERVALLVQVIEGERWGKYYFPHAAGVGFSRNTYRWSPQIRPEDGFLRLVWGLGTRAVDRVGNDYPRLVALSHPLLRPKASPDAILRYSQQYIDLINLESNKFETLPIHEVLTKQYPLLRYFALIDQGGYLTPIRSRIISSDVNQFVLTLEGLLQRTPLANHMRSILNLLEAKYQRPVDTEFTVYITEPRSSNPGVKIALLQCRPQSHIEEIAVSLPENLPADNIIFSTRRMVPHGSLSQIRYVLFVPPEGYYALPTPRARSELGRAIGRLNETLAGETFICLGPGRWGTANPDLGVQIGYADIYNTSALIELTGSEIGPEPEPSYGTHFFQDLVEAHIYPLAIYLDDDDVVFNHDFFYNTPNRLANLAPKEATLEGCLRLIDASTYLKNYHLALVMDADQGQAVCFLERDP